MNFPLQGIFAATCVLMCCIFIFLCLKIFLNFSFFPWPIVDSGRHYLVSTYLWIFQFYSCNWTDFYFHTIVVGKDASYDFNLFKEWMFHVHLKIMCILLSLSRMSVKSIWSNISLKFSISLLIFCLDDPVIDERVMLKFPTIIVLLSIHLYRTILKDSFAR